MSVMVPKHQFTEPTQEAQFFDQVLQRVRALPGVKSAGAIDDLPLAGGSNQPVAVEGRPVVPMSEQPEVSVRVITPGYLEAMRIPVLQGRDITATDTADSGSVVVVSQSMAKQLWPNQSPIGRHLKLTFYPDKDREVVGVVGDVKQTDSTAQPGSPPSIGRCRRVQPPRWVPGEPIPLLSSFVPLPLHRSSPPPSQAPSAR